MKIYFATSNKGKLNEIQKMLTNLNIKIVHLNKPYPEIQSDSLEEIASFGAKYLVKEIKETVIVEDSGIFINTFNLFPGPYSKFVFQNLGLDGILKLLKNENNRNAYFKSVISFCCPGNEPLIFTGICNGKISKERNGSNGFGYDPIFIPKDSNLTFGQMDINQKNSFSHRGKAFGKFVEFLTSQ